MSNPKPRKQRPRIDQYGTKRWYLNRKLHRLDGPAVEYSNGTAEWFLNDRLHRDNGPAITDAKGNKWWYQNGQQHREDGPSVEYADGTCLWYYRNRWIDANSNETFKLKVDQFKREEYADKYL